MNKVRTAQWVGLVPFFILVVLLIIVWFLTNFNILLFYILALVVLVGMYLCTNLFFYELFQYGERALIDDKEILELEKEEASLWWMYVSGAGFTFLVGGIPLFKQYPFFALVGLIFLIAGNLIYNIFYYPRYRLLYRNARYPSIIVQ